MSRRFGQLVIVAICAATWACSRNLQCYEGAMEVNGVCECPNGTTYNRSNNACISGDASLGDAGNCTMETQKDEQAKQVDSHELSTNASHCADSEVRCDGSCVNPSTDAKHCGGCSPCRTSERCSDGMCVPSEVGCSDGTREAFVDRNKYPSIAGCGAMWSSASLKDARKLASCGNAIRACETPLDACAQGWHVCGDTDEGASDITTRIVQADCDGQEGSFAAALDSEKCALCSAEGNGAVCCGTRCLRKHQGSCVWPAKTSVFADVAEVIQQCGKSESAMNWDSIGVMCCQDKE